MNLVYFMSRNRVQDSLFTFKTAEVLGNKIPLIDVLLECPKVGSFVRIKALLDTGSRYSLLDDERAFYCFPDLESRYFDLVYVNGVLTKRYSITLKLGDVEFRLPVALFDFGSINAPVIPEMILGREGLLESSVLTFYKNSFISMYLDR